MILSTEENQEKQPKKEYSIKRVNKIIARQKAAAAAAVGVTGSNLMYTVWTATVGDAYL